MTFNFSTGEIASVCTLIGTLFMIGKIIFGQGKAKAREEGFVDKFTELKTQDEEFKTEISGIKTDISDIKINQEKSFGEVKLGIKDLENNFLREIRKINGR